MLRITGENSIKEDWGCEAVDGEWSCKRTNKPMDIFDDTLTEDDREKTLAYDLAWVNEPSYLMGGYYNNDYQFTKKLCESEKIELGYQNSEFLSDGTLVASGNVEMMSCDQEIYGNNAVINLTDDFAGIRSLVMTGNVIAKQPSTGILIRTTEMGTNMNDGNYSTG